MKYDHKHKIRFHSTFLMLFIVNKKKNNELPFFLELKKKLY